jgi:hypothetical protein
MLEIEQMEEMVSVKERESLGVSRERLEIFAKRLQTFIKNSAFSPYVLTHMYMKQSVIDMNYKIHDEFLGVISPSELPENGVGSIFLVAWNNNGTTMNGNTVTPMEIWLAKGKSISKSEGENKKLLVDYISLGTLKHGTKEIKNESRSAKSGSRSIYLNSKIILTP